jgi:hypothetical protein
LRAHPETPSILKAGVRYKPDPPGDEDWRSIPEILRRKGGDCEDLACWMAAELKEKGIECQAAPLTKNGREWHIVVRLSDGEIIDPSLLLGMGKK